MKYRMLRGSDVIRKGDQYFTRYFVLEGEWLADSTSHGDKVSRWMNKGDVFNILAQGWDLMVFFWPYFNLAVSGARWFKDKREAQELDIMRFRLLLECEHIQKIAGENPIGVLSTRIRKPDQIIQPWMFGHGETKATCLWLKNLPLLKPTNIVSGRTARVHREPPGPERWKNRSRTLIGVSEAMAEQWGR